MKKYLSVLILSFMLLVLVGFCLPAGRQVLADDLGTQCDAIASNGCSSGMSSADCKTLLQKCDDYYAQQSAQLSQDLTKTSAQKDTLQNAISKLKKEDTGFWKQI